MRLTRKPGLGRGNDRDSKQSTPMTSVPSFTRQRPSRRPSRQNIETLVTLFKRDSTGSSSGRDEEQLDDDVSMSQHSRKVIPATFNIVRLEGKDAVTSGAASSSDLASFDQAGGHEGSFKSDGGILVKKVTEREASFYELAEEEGLWPASLLPKFYGRVDGDSIKIENLTHGFARPCVMDLKMGVQTVEDDESSLLKKVKMKALDVVTGTKSVGCRLEGLSMYRTLDRIKGTKAQSHSISAHVRVSLQDVITFFLTDESGVRTDLALRFQTAVEGILRQFEENDKFRFIGSSILFIYDNDNYTPYMRWARALRKLHVINPAVRLREDQISGLTRRTKCDVRMIDFAHTGPMPRDMVKDEGYITGLNTILKALKAIRTYRAKPIFSLGSAVVDVMEDSRATVMARSASQGGGIPFAEGDFTFGTLLGELTPMAEGEEDSHTNLSANT